MAKSVAALLRERQMVVQSGMKPHLIDHFVKEIDAQIEELAAQGSLSFKTAPPGSPVQGDASPQGRTSKG